MNSWSAETHAYLLQSGKQANYVTATSLNRMLSAMRAAGSPYTISSAATVTIPAGTYSNVVATYISPASPQMIVGAGRVILTGGPDTELVSPDIKNIGIANNTSTLILGQGHLTGDIRLAAQRPNSSSYYGGTLLIGETQSDSGGQVTITGTIGGNSRARSTVVRTQGADLIVDGVLGDRSMPINTVEAKTGDIRVVAITPIASREDRLGASQLSIDAGRTIEVAGGILAMKLSMEENSTLMGNAPTYAFESPGRIEIGNTSATPGSAIGKMEKGSRILNPNNNVFLVNGLSNGAGEIGGLSIASYAGDHPGNDRLTINDITQKESVTESADVGLSLRAKQDVVAANITAHTITAGTGTYISSKGQEVTAKTGRIIAGTIFNADDTHGTAPNDPDVYNIEIPDGNMPYGRGSFAPRYTITSNNVQAPTGGVYAGELNMEGPNATISAGNLLLAKEQEKTVNGPPAHTYPASSGNMSMGQGSFSFTGAPINPDSSSGKRVIPYAAQIDGSLEVGAEGKGNGASSFTTLNINGDANINGGSLSGNSLDGNANESLFRAANAALTNVNSVTIKGTLETTGNLAIKPASGSARAVNNVSTTNVGVAANITAKSYTGNDFTAGSAEFDKISAIDLGTLTAPQGLAIASAKKGHFNIGSTTVKSADAAIPSGRVIVTGGAFSGNSLTAGSDAQFNSVSGVQLRAAHIEGNLDVSGRGTNAYGDLTVANSINSEGGKFQAEQVTAGGNFTLHDGSFRFGDAKPSEIRGNLTATANASSSFGTLTAGSFNVSDGYVEGKSLHASSAAFTNNVVAQFDELVLTGSETSLEIEEGSTVIVSKIHAESGTVDVSTSGLILASDLNEAPVADLGHFVLTEGTISADPSTPTIINAKSITGTGLDASNDNITGHQLIVEDPDKTSPDSGTVDITDANLNLTGIGQFGSRIENNLLISQNHETALGDMQVGGRVDIKGGTVQARKLAVTGDASFAVDTLKLSGSGESASIIGGDFILTDTRASIGDASVKVKTVANGGSLAGHTLKTGSADLAGTDTALYKLDTQGDASFSNLSLDLAGADSARSQIGGNLSLTDSESAITEATVKGETRVQGGSLTVHSLKTGSAHFENALLAELDELILDKTGTTQERILGIESPESSKTGTRVEITSLNLNGGTLNAGTNSASPAIVAIQHFGQSAAGARDIDGHINIGANGRVILGTRDLAWLPATLDSAPAILALAQPMRLAADMGIHVTGTGQPHAAPGKIQFDAGSLFVIDGSNSRVYYAANWYRNTKPEDVCIPTAQLSETNGAPGALASEKATAASIGNDSQIYIRNPKPNTVIVALGQNISTRYADQATPRQGRTTGAAPWTAANLKYDNGDKVIIKRLTGQYAGQFSVMPIENNTDTPPAPPEDNKPENPAPSGPGDNPPAPSKPGDDTPSTPANPGNNPPSNPSVPGSNTPAAPSQPAMPKPDTTHPGAHPGIHQVIENGGNSGTIGNKPHHLVTDHGAGFLSHTITHHSPRQATQLAEGASRAIILGAVPQLALSANSAAEATLAQRASLVPLLADKGIHARSIALWAVPLYRASSAWSLEADSQDFDYHGGIGGIAIGGDITFGDRLRAGVAFNIGGGYSKSGGNLPETTNNMTFWGLGAYGGWTNGDFGISADLAFTSSYNKIRQDVSPLAGWSDLKGDAQAYALTAGASLEYIFRCEFLDIIPHAGIKFHFIHVDDYDLKHNGKEIINGGNFDQNIWTFPAGVRLGKELEFENGWYLKPMLDFHITPAAGDIDARTTTRFTNTQGEITLKTQTRDYLTWGGTASLEASYGDFSIGVNYSLDAGAHTTYNTIFGTFRYEF